MVDMGGCSSMWSGEAGDLPSCSRRRTSAVAVPEVLPSVPLPPSQSCADLFPRGLHVCHLDDTSLATLKDKYLERSTLTYLL